MSDVAAQIMDAAEKHIRMGGYGAFSFRDLATEVGVKSSSVHYHFPTKEKLAAAVINRYTARVAQAVDQAFEHQSDPVKVMAKAFGNPVHSSDRLCPCIVLGAEIFDLPSDVIVEVRNYYRMWFDKLAARGLPKGKASVIMSTLLGAQMLAAVFDDVDKYDDAAKEVLREHAAAA